MCSSSALATRTRAAAFCCWARFLIRPAWPSVCLRLWIPTRCAIIAAAGRWKGGECNDVDELLSDLFRSRIRLQPDLVSQRRHELAFSLPALAWRTPALRRTRAD